MKAVKTITALLCLLIVFELLLRVTGVSYPYFEQADAELGLRLSPNAQGWHTTEGNAFVRINSQGMRDVEHTVQKAPNTIRIAILGDSFAEARQVDYHQTYWAKLPNELSTCNTFAGNTVEVLNFGTTNFGTAQQYLQLQQQVLAYQPDLVVLTFNSDDLANNSIALGGKQARPYFVQTSSGLVLDTSFTTSAAFLRQQTSWYRATRAILQRSYTAQLLFQRARMAKQALQNQHSNSTAEPEIGVFAEWYQPPSTDAMHDAWNSTEAILTSMHTISAEHDATFIVHIASAAHQVMPDAVARAKLLDTLHIQNPYYIEERLEQWGKAHSVPVIPTAPALFKQAVATNTYYHGFTNTALGTGHWNIDGHQAVAQLLGNSLCNL